MHDRVIDLLAARRGHFLLESGHHGELWLDLELLCRRPRQIQPLVAALAQRLSAHALDGVCGPLTEGAFIALMVAAELDVPFSYAERVELLKREGLYPVGYRIPKPLREELRGKRIAIVNDVINAGSAVRGTFTDLRSCGAQPVGIGALVVLGSWAATFAEEENVELTSLVQLPNTVWLPSECPLCASGTPLDNAIS